MIKRVGAELRPVNSMPSQRGMDRDQRLAQAALDRERHLASVRMWLREHGYGSAIEAAQCDHSIRELVQPLLEEEVAMAQTTRGEAHRISGFKSAVQLTWLRPDEEPPVTARPRVALADEVVAEPSTAPGRWAQLEEVGPSLAGELRKRGATVVVHSNGAREAWAKLPADA